MEKNQAGQGAPPTKASTQDVLSPQVGKSNVDPKWEGHDRSLREFREQILTRQRDLLSQAAEEVTPPQRNMAEQGTDQYDRDFALGLASSDQERLYEIEQALNRIRDGTYGICEATGKPIEPERLRVIPWARFSAEAEQALEAQGQVRPPGVGDRREVRKEPAGR